MNMLIYQTTLFSACLITLNTYIHTPYYEVWQKSNETDLLLTLNVVIFLQIKVIHFKSSLGQLHSDICVGSSVRSNAGGLLLEYLSARQLRSSGYYKRYQNGALSGGF
jgi:hypothetical protein